MSDFQRKSEVQPVFAAVGEMYQALADAKKKKKKKIHDQYHGDDDHDDDGQMHDIALGAVNSTTHGRDRNAFAAEWRRHKQTMILPDKLHTYVIMTFQHAQFLPPSATAVEPQHDRDSDETLTPTPVNDDEEDVQTQKVEGTHNSREPHPHPSPHQPSPSGDTHDNDSNMRSPPPTTTTTSSRSSNNLRLSERLAQTREYCNATNVKYNVKLVEFTDTTTTSAATLMALSSSQKKTLPDSEKGDDLRDGGSAEKSANPKKMINKTSSGGGAVGGHKTPPPRNDADTYTTTAVKHVKQGLSMIEYSEDATEWKDESRVVFWRWACALMDAMKRSRTEKEQHVRHCRSEVDSCSCDGSQHATTTATSAAAAAVVTENPAAADNNDALLVDAYEEEEEEEGESSAVAPPWTLVDWVDPATGLPCSGTCGPCAWNEADAVEQFVSGCDVVHVGTAGGGCRLVVHPRFGENVYPATAVVVLPEYHPPLPSPIAAPITASSHSTTMSMIS